MASDSTATSPTDAEAREARELAQLLWFFWAGIGLATTGESALVFLMQLESSSSSYAATPSLSLASTLVVVGLGAAMLTGVVVAYRRGLGGGGLATALICWMLSKAIVILGLTMAFLSAGYLLTLPFLATFITTMALLHPRRFTG